jgi:hypothetical protein
MFSAQLNNAVIPFLEERSTNCVAGLNLNIPVNTRECFRLTDFWVTPSNNQTYPVGGNNEYFGAITWLIEGDV